MSSVASGVQIDQATAIALEETRPGFPRPVDGGIPTNADEEGLRRLAAQIAARKVVGKAVLAAPAPREAVSLVPTGPAQSQDRLPWQQQPDTGRTVQAGELNVDVMEVDACDKLARWFEDRWNDRFALDISDELVRAIDESWASERLVPPFHVYLKIAWHLSRDARAGLSEFEIPEDIDALLFDFQKAAVKIAAHHVQARGGVMLGDVVGLGKTLMATARRRGSLEDDPALQHSSSARRTLSRCGKRTASATTPSEGASFRITMVQRVLPESPALSRRHPRREPQPPQSRGPALPGDRGLHPSQREPRMLLTATPYNKTYLDLGQASFDSSLPDERRSGHSPREICCARCGETMFIQQHQCGRALARGLFEKSEHATTGAT